MSKCLFDGHKDEDVDNRYVIPTNLTLLSKYKCDTNVKYCTTITAIKYLYKYIYKRCDEHEHKHIIREYDDFINCRFFSVAEACWKIFKPKIKKRYPSIKRLSIHLQNKTKLKKDIPVILLYNINASHGLCTGICLITNNLFENIIKCYKLTDKKKENPIYISKIKYEFIYKQFSIHKLQGQTLLKYNQLYLTISRIKKIQQYKILQKKNEWNLFIHGKFLFGKIQQIEINQIKNKQKVKFV